MTLEAGKEMDRRCVWNWLNDVYYNPTVAFNTYSDEQQIEFAHDALVLLKEKEPKTGHWIESAGDDKCSVCGSTYSDLYPDYRYTHYCPNCGAKMIGTDVPDTNVMGILTKEHKQEFE